MVIRAAHRLPAVKRRPPIIFKMNTKADKQLIWDNMENLKAYNEAQTNNDTKIYIDLKNLPAKLNKDKKELFEQFKQLRDTGKKPKWKFDKSAGEYFIQVGRRQIRPRADNFLFTLKEQDEEKKEPNAWNRQDLNRETENSSDTDSDV